MYANEIKRHYWEFNAKIKPVIQPVNFFIKVLIYYFAHSNQIAYLTITLSATRSLKHKCVFVFEFCIIFTLFFLVCYDPQQLYLMTRSWLIED